MAKKTKAQLVAQMQALQAEMAEAEIPEADVRKDATKATTAALEAVEAKDYQQNIKTIKMLDMILRSENPAAALEAAIKAGAIKPLGKSTLDVRVDGIGGVDVAAKKYTARSASATTASSNGTSFKVGSWPESITFTNNTKEITAAMVIKTVARLYAVKIDDKANWPGRNIPWSTHATQSKWALLITGPVVKNGVEKSKDGQTTVGAMVTFTDATKPAMLLTEWLTAQVTAYKATVATA